MQSVGAGAIGNMAEMPLEAEASRRLVLPRLLRKPARMLLHKDWKLPRYVGLKAMAAFFTVTAVAGTLIGGHTMTVVSAVTSEYATMKFWPLAYHVRAPGWVSFGAMS